MRVSSSAVALLLALSGCQPVTPSSDDTDPVPPVETDDTEVPVETDDTVVETDTEVPVETDTEVPIETDESDTPVDADGDGATADVDCDDADEDVFPGADERCNTVDDDCDGTIDEDAIGAPAWYADADGDGFGTTGSVQVACDAPTADAVALDGDCDDDDDGVFPDAEESCDGVDDDCDGVIDEPGAVGGTSWYVDLDGDTFGDASSGAVLCAPPADGVLRGGDCDDADVAVNPAAAEHCNGADDDCDAIPDEGAVDETTFYGDADGDGHGDPATAGADCLVPADAALVGDDCDDADDTRYAGADETCDGVDDDCDGPADEDPVDGAEWFLDEDGDGFAGTSVGRACTPPADATDDGTDCDDASVDAFPGAPERCDGRPNDCDALASWDPADEDGLVSFTDGGPLQDATASFTGDLALVDGTWLLCRGTYDVSLSAVGVTTELIGVTDGVVLTGGGLHRVLDLGDAGDVTLSRLALVDGATDGKGGAVLVEDGGALHGDTLRFEDGTATAGGGGCVAVALGGTAELVDVDLVDCRAHGDGGAVWSEGDTSWTGGTLSGGVAGGSGGGVHVAGGSLTTEGVVVEGCSAANGGGLSATAGALRLDAEIRDNDATNGGGLFLQVGAGLTLEGTPTVSGNLASSMGGGAVIVGGGDALDVGAMLFTGNEAPLVGGLISQVAGTVRFTGTIFRGNRTIDLGGGLVAAGGEVHLDGVVAEDNVATPPAPDEGGGGGIVLANGTGTVTNTTVARNRSSGQAGGLYFQAFQATVTDTVVEANEARTIAAGLGVNASTVKVVDSTIEGNLGVIGGGVFVNESSALTLVRTTVVGNHATWGAGAYVETGTLTCGDGDTAASAAIVGNVTDDPGQGAGVYLAPSEFLDPTFVADVCDLGASGTTDDNVADGVTPTFDQDVRADAGTYGFGDGASVTCTGQTGCPAP